MTGRILCIALVTAMTSLSSAAKELAVGEDLPELRGEYLSGRKAVVPKDASDRVALLLFGFHLSVAIRGGSLDQTFPSRF